MDFAALAQECAPWVAHETMAAIVRTESGFRPLAIGINGGAKLTRQPETKAEAVATAKWLIANGYNIDMGLGQVNSANLPKIGLTVENAFDPCQNIAASATILHGNYRAAKRKTGDDQVALHAALSAYNTGSFTRGFSNGYVQRVVGNAAPQGQKPAPPIRLVPAKAAKPKAKRPDKAQPPKAPPEGQPQEQVAGDVYSRNTKSVMVY